MRTRPSGVSSSAARPGPGRCAARTSRANATLTMSSFFTNWRKLVLVRNRPAEPGWPSLSAPRRFEARLGKVPRFAGRRCVAPLVSPAIPAAGTRAHLPEAEFHLPPVKPKSSGTRFLPLWFHATRRVGAPRRRRASARIVVVGATRYVDGDNSFFCDEIHPQELIGRIGDYCR